MDDRLPLQGAGTDGRYDHTKPWDQLPSWAQNRPWGSNEERLTTQAIQLALASSPEVQDTVRVPLPQVDLFPPRFGYRDRQLGISDIVDVDQLFEPPPANDDFSGSPAGYEGTARNSWNQGSW